MPKSLALLAARVLSMPNFLRALVAFYCLSSAIATAQVGIDVSRISAEPSFEDFSEMSPSTALARSMTKVDDFTQRLPDDGDAASQRTEVYIGYDQEQLHVIFLAFDDNPSQIRANLSSRENIDGDDIVEMVIDTFNDQRAAFAFRSTPLGMQWDARWTEGSSMRAGFDTTLETVWESDGQVTDQGYMVKMAIPLRSLRFLDRPEQLWRPINRLRVLNTYLNTELETKGGAKVFTNRIARSNWNYQFTKEWSLRFIAQYDETDAGPATRLVDDENLNFDLLLRYVINPWSALFIGYNTNQSNFDIVDMEGERELVIANDLRKDGEQFFVKFSYLFQR